MAKLTFAVIAVLHLIFGSYATALQEVELPQNIKICRRSEQNYASCLLNAIQDSWPTIVKGVPELDFPAIDPLIIDRFERNVKFGSLVGSALFTDVRYLGFAEAKFSSVQPRFSGNQITIDIKLTMPQMVIKADYKVQGSLESISISGEGFMNLTLEGYRSKWSLDGYVKNDRLILTRFRDEPEVTGMKVYFSNLFNGNQALNNAALVLANQAWPLLYNTGKPVIAGFTNAFVPDFLNRSFFSKVSVSKLFPN